MLQNARIILIDDEVKMTKLLKLIVEDHLSCEIEIFNDARAALERLQEAEFDVISLDHRMPGLKGMEIAKLLRTNPDGVNSKTPILLFTGFLEEAESLAIDLLDDLIFLEKPVDDQRYIHNLKMALSMKKVSVLTSHDEAPVGPYEEPRGEENSDVR